MPSAGPGAAQATQTARPILTRVVIQLFCVELGLILLLLPWTLLWDNNFFFSLQPQYSRFWLSNELRNRHRQSLGRDRRVSQDGLAARCLSGVASASSRR